MCHPFSAHA
jgi:hypothetical protein